MIRLLVIEEVRALCETICAALRGEVDLAVIGGAATLDEAVPLLRACDLALVNATGPADDSAAVIRTIRRLAPRVKVVAMGLAPSQPAIRQCEEAGAAGYALRDSSLAELMANIRAAYHNTVFVSPPLAAGLLAYATDLAGCEEGGGLAAHAPQPLTRREREVLTLVQQGLTNQEIAGSLVIELGTVKNHVHNILRKLNVNSRRDAVHVSRLAGLWAMSEARSKPVLPRLPERAVYAASVGATA